MNIEQKINKLEQELNKLKQQTKNCMPKYWDFKIGEKFYYIYIAKVYSSDYVDSGFEKDLILSGNIFRTKKEAEKELELRLATQRLKEAIWEANGGEFIGFTPEVTNYMVTTDNNIVKVSRFEYAKTTQDWMYIKDEETAERILEKNRTDFEIYYGLN